MFTPYELPFTAGPAELVFAELAPAVDRAEIRLATATACGQAEQHDGGPGARRRG